MVFRTISPITLMCGKFVGQGGDGNDAGDRIEADLGIHDPAVEHHELAVLTHGLAAPHAAGDLQVAVVSQRGQPLLFDMNK